MENCNICFDDYIESNMISCIDDKCNAFICKECFENYISSSDTIVKCVKQNCKYHYIKHNFKNFEINPDIMSKYEKMCYKYFQDENRDEINNNITYFNLVQKLREDRNIFVKTFPVSIQKIINVCMKDRLNKIDKNNKLFFDSIVNSPGHYCMLSFCNGKLDSNFKCLKCETEFCNKCKKIKKEGHHECKIEDLLSVEYMKNIGQCPNCKISIEKSEGCRSMKCTNCNTHFDYYTGNKAYHGGLNTDITVKESVKLSSLYRGIYNDEIIEILIKFESCIKRDDDEKLRKRIIGIMSKEKSINKISDYFNSFIIARYNYVNFMNKISEIEQFHENGELNLNTLNMIIG